MVDAAPPWMHSLRHVALQDVLTTALQPLDNVMAASDAAGSAQSRRRHLDMHKVSWRDGFMQKQCCTTDDARSCSGQWFASCLTSSVLGVSQ